MELNKTVSNPMLVGVMQLIKADGKTPDPKHQEMFMEELDKKYPEYEFSKHKGYVTKRHLELLDKYGVSEVHRKSFSPVMERMKKWRSI